MAKTFAQWKEILPTAYHYGEFPNGTAYFTCPMSTRNEYSLEQWQLEFPELEFSVDMGNNEDPCSYWFSVSIPASQLRQPTALETGMEKLEKFLKTLSTEERAALNFPA